jgi:hypothetical protein
LNQVAPTAERLFQDSQAAATGPQLRNGVTALMHTR